MCTLNQDFYGSSNARKLIKEVREMGYDAGPDKRVVLVPIVLQIWHENCVSLRNDAIDFLLL
eukprot:1158197-Pelagomonas_calceolata.AAC.8